VAAASGTCFVCSEPMRKHSTVTWVGLEQVGRSLTEDRNTKVDRCWIWTALLTILMHGLNGHHGHIPDTIQISL